MKKNGFKVNCVSTASANNSGTLTVTVYPNPKSSHPKIMVQGKMYMAFVTFTLPTIIKAMRDASDSIPMAVSNLDLSSDDKEDSCTNLRD